MEPFGGVPECRQLARRAAARVDPAKPAEMRGGDRHRRAAEKTPPITVDSFSHVISPSPFCCGRTLRVRGAAGDLPTCMKPEVATAGPADEGIDGTLVSMNHAVRRQTEDWAKPIPKSDGRVRSARSFSCARLCTRTGLILPGILKSGGMNIGLFVSRSMVEKHHGGL